MKTGRSLMELAAEIQRQHESKIDYIVPTQKVEFIASQHGVTSLEFDVNDQKQSLITTKHTNNLIAERLGIPTRYFNRMKDEQPHLLQENVNTWLQAAPESRMIRTLDGKARAYLSNKYKLIDHVDVFEAVLPVLKDIPGVDFKSCQVTDDRLYLKVVSQKTQKPVRSRRVNDLVEAGVIISNSEIGLGKISIHPFFHFLVCTNGMVRHVKGQGYSMSHLGGRYEQSDQGFELSDDTKRLEDLAILSRSKDIITAALDETLFQKTIEELEATTQNRIEGKIEKVVEVTAKHLTLSGDEQESVLKHLIEGGDLSQYGLMNAVTRTAQDIGSYDRATEIETMGGKILDLSPRQWREISQAA